MRNDRLSGNDELSPPNLSLVDVANSINPPVLENLPKGYPGITNGQPYHIDYITEKSDRILGLKHRSREDMVRDTLTCFKEKGFAQ